MDKLIKFLKSFGLNEQEVQKVLKEIPVDQSGLAGTNVAKGIFEKGGKEVSADYPLVTETMVSPFKLDKYKGLTRKETLEKADEALNFLDKELTRTSNLILNQNLQLSPEQKINFANNLRMKRQFEKDLEIFKSKPEAEIIKFETKKPVSKEGIEQLTEEVGLMAPPTTPVGEAQLKLKQVEQGLKDILKNQTKFDDILKDPIESQIRYAQLQRSGLVRAVAREIIEQDIKSGKLKLRPIVEEGMVNPTGSGLDGDPIEVYRLYYGEDALEQLDSLAPDFSKSYTAKDAAKIAREKFPNIQPREKPIREYLTPNEVDEMTRNNPLRKLTREEIEDYEAAIGRSSEEWLSEGTLDEAEKALKRSQDEYAYYSNLYKKGKLDPAPGEQTEDRMKFLQKKLQEASDVKDKRLISPNELKELEELETRFLTKEPIKNEDQTKTLTDFDITDREPNASGGRSGRTQSRGLDYLMGL